MGQVRNAEEHGRQQERLLTATRQSCDQLKQQVQDQDQQLQEQQKRAAKVSPSSSFTHQTAYKHHIACSILWMQGCSVTAHCVADAGLRSQPIAMPTYRNACLHKHNCVQPCNAPLQYALTCLTAYHVCNRYISTDSHHQLWRQSSKPYNIPVTLDCHVQESEMKSIQLAQQELATRLAAHQELERVRPATYVHILRGSGL